MSPSTAPPFCSLTRTARIVPLTRPQTITFCAMTLPSTCAPSLIWRSEARTSPSIRPKTCAGPLHSMLPTIDMSEPMQEAVPAFVVGSDLAQAWSCGCTVPPHDFGRICRRVLIFLGCAALHAIQHLHLHARADARSRFRSWYQRGRRDLFNNRVLLLHHPPHDFGRICRRVLILLVGLAFVQPAHLLFPPVMRVPATGRVWKLLHDGSPPPRGFVAYAAREPGRYFGPT